MTSWGWLSSSFPSAPPAQLLLLCIRLQSAVAHPTRTDPQPIRRIELQRRLPSQSAHGGQPAYADQQGQYPALDGYWNASEFGQRADGVGWSSNATDQSQRGRPGAAVRLAILIEPNAKRLENGSAVFYNQTGGRYLSFPLYNRDPSGNQSAGGRPTGYAIFHPLQTIAALFGYHGGRQSTHADATHRQYEKQASSRNSNCSSASNANGPSNDPHFKPARYESEAQRTGGDSRPEAAGGESGSGDRERRFVGGGQSFQENPAYQGFRGFQEFQTDRPYQENFGNQDRFGGRS